MEKCVNILLQIETQTLLLCDQHTCRWAADMHGGLIRVDTVHKKKYCSIVTSVDPVNVQADLSVPCSHVSKGQFLFGEPEMIMGSAWILMNISVYMYSMVAYCTWLSVEYNKLYPNFGGAIMSCCWGILAPRD